MELKVLTASEGMVLTNGEAYGKAITLGKNDNPENWHEISEAEYEKMQTVIKEQFESEV
ncbi:MAG: hypothetical protein J6B22_03760 [Clostridia bacterium]|nr:hypothetical protein [Clostridia bacterium]MBO5321707.1 hypothetical protein [Clostridia bacterium]